MTDVADSETAPGADELKEWLCSSLCGCVVSKVQASNLEDKQNSDNNENSAESISSLDAAILEKMWADGKVFQWLLHSFKPELVPCPSTDGSAGEEDFPKLQSAFKIAQDEFGVLNLLLADDFSATKESERKADSLVLLTYLAQLKHALRNVEPACPATRLRLTFVWPYAGEEESVYLRSTIDSPKCCDCHETVLILDRFLLSSADTSSSANDVRHRRCFRCERCHKLLRIGLYRPTKSGIGYECLEHEKEDLVARLTPAPDPKPKQEEGASEEKAKIYPELAKEEQGPLYPPLPSLDEKVLDTSADSRVVESSSPELIARGSSAGKLDELLSPPAPSRSRSSERDVPVPAPRKSVHTRGGSDSAPGPVSVSTENVSPTSPSAVSPSGKSPGRPERPALPPKPKAVSPAVQVRRHYPEELNPFDEAVTSRHSTPPVSNVNKPKADQRRSMAVRADIKAPASVKPAKANGEAAKAQADYDKSLNPFGTDSESDDDEKAGDDDDTSSLSSTNPFNDSGDESDGKETPLEDAKGSAKKIPPPRPPPPSKRISAPTSSTPKQAAKKRLAPPPPPTASQGGPPPRPASPKKQYRKKRPAPPRPLPLKRQIRTESALSPDQLAAAFDQIEKQLLEVETDSGSFEKNLRQTADEKGFAKFPKNDIHEWINFVHRKFDLIRKETELVYMRRERQLDELHAEIEFQLRCIIEKPESEKTSEDLEREESLLQRMLDVIKEKSKLVDNQDEIMAQTGSLPRNSIQLDDSSLSAGTASKSSTLDKSSRGGKTAEEKRAKKKKKIKLRLKKLKQKIANSALLRHS